MSRDNEEGLVLIKVSDLDKWRKKELVLVKTSDITKLYKKKQVKIAREIFEELTDTFKDIPMWGAVAVKKIAELKKKYESEGEG